MCALRNEALRTFGEWYLLPTASSSNFNQMVYIHSHFINNKHPTVPPEKEEHLQPSEPNEPPPSKKTWRWPVKTLPRLPPDLLLPPLPLERVSADLVASHPVEVAAVSSECIGRANILPTDPHPVPRLVIVRDDHLTGEDLQNKILPRMYYALHPKDISAPPTTRVVNRTPE